MSAKTEARVRVGDDWVQLWGEGTGDELIVLRLLGARGRAELATQDPANRLADVASTVWTLNRPGLGASNGPITVEHYLSGTLAAHDFLVARYPQARIWVYGKSIGAAAAIHVAAHRPLSGLVVKNTVDLEEFNPAFWAPACRCPALFVISLDDQVAPPDSQLRIASAYGGSSTILRVQGGHDERTLHAADEVRYAEAVTTLWRTGRR